MCKGLSQQFLGKAISSENFLETSQLELSVLSYIWRALSCMHLSIPPLVMVRVEVGICTSIGVWGLCVGCV